jgi:uridine kinase
VLNTSTISKSNEYSSSPFEERKTNCKNSDLFDELISWNNTLEIPIFLSIKNNTIEKIISYFTNTRNGSVTIGLAGETASGKSTITNSLISSFNSYAQLLNLSDFITKVNIDDYYYDRSEMVKAAGSFDKFVETYDLDSPSAFELSLLANHLELLKAGKSVYLPKYDMSGTAKRYDNVTLANPSRIIVAEGLYTFNEQIHSSFDIKIYVDIDEHIQKIRWYNRAKERDLGDSADRVYTNALEKAKIYIRPTKLCADIIINGEAKISDYDLFFKKLTNILLKINNREKEALTV